jgi:hypothetical protein
VLRVKKEFRNFRLISIFRSFLAATYRQGEGRAKSGANKRFQFIAVVV